MSISEYNIVSDARLSLIKNPPIPVNEALGSVIDRRIGSVVPNQARVADFRAHGGHFVKFVETVLSDADIWLTPRPLTEQLHLLWRWRFADPWDKFLFDLIQQSAPSSVEDLQKIVSDLNEVHSKLSMAMQERLVAEQKAGNMRE